MNMVYAVNGAEVISSVQEDYDKLDGFKSKHTTITQSAVELDGVIVRDNSALKNNNGVIEYDDEAVANRKEAARKQAHEQAAYQQQDSFFTPNKRHLFDGVVYNAPPADMDQLPKMNSYRVFMKALWTEYHTRIATGSEDYDYSGFYPETEYSYVELEQEWSDYNNVST